LYFEADFSGDRPEARLGQSSAANYFVHLGGDAAKRLLAGQSSVEVMYQGGIRLYERIVSVRDDRIDAPDAKHLYGNFPDPFLCFANARAKRMRSAPSPKRVAPFECALFAPVAEDGDELAKGATAGCQCVPPGLSRRLPILMTSA